MESEMDDLVKMLRDRHDYYLSGLTEKQDSLLSLAADEIESLRQQLAECERERDELKANSDRYELLREMKLYEMMEYRCLPVPIEDADDWFDAQTDAKIRERYPRATIGADKTVEK